MGPSAKRFTRGTHRQNPPEETLESVRPLCPRFGITRVADVTGLDRIGLPVFMVVRPESRSLAVAQGKGLDAASAMVSGLMESIETWFAERVEPDCVASWHELSTADSVVDVRRLPPRRESKFHDKLAIPWVVATDLLDAERPVWVPFALVHSDYTVPPPPGAGCFCSSTNGLASGNNRDEAIVHGISEVIERDALAIWHHRSAEFQSSTRIDPATIDDPDVLEIMARLEAADFDVSIFDATSDVGVPVFHAEIVERGVNAPLFFSRVISGDGCHPVREIALLRALTEAAQSRLTYISGSREDIEENVYGQLHRAVSETDQPPQGDRAAKRAYTDVPTFESDSLAKDVEHLLNRLAAIGLPEVAIVDLSRPDFDGIAVVRVIIPGLATIVDHPCAMHWSRLPKRPAMQIVPSRQAMM